MPNAPTYPIILAHGIARFDVLTNNLFQVDNSDEKDELHYFRNIRTFLESHGFDVHHTNVDWAGSLVKRAADLKRQTEQILQATGAVKVHIIGHSMGGLDARRMLWDNRSENFHHKVASVTTIGTPHHGSSFADFLSKGLREDAEAIGLGFDGVIDLRTNAMAAFNAEVSDWERQSGVRFRAYAGKQRLIHVFTPLKLSWLIIQDREGDNDGFVSVASARWSDEYFVPPVLDADHLNEIGWWDISENWHGVTPEQLETRIKNVYLGMARELADAFPT
jgi:triacylglycerol lipase